MVALLPALLTGIVHQSRKGEHVRVKRGLRQAQVLGHHCLVLQRHPRRRVRALGPPHLVVLGVVVVAAAVVVVVVVVVREVAVAWRTTMATWWCCTVRGGCMVPPCQRWGQGRGLAWCT